LFIILKYKRSGFSGTLLFFWFFAKMTTQTFDDLTDKLQRTYNAVLLHIVHEIEIAQEKEIHFYFSRHIPRGVTGTLDILRSLENAGKISWRDVCFLKEGLIVTQRFDLVKSLTAFEIKRDLTILLDFYARNRQGYEPCCRSASVEQVAGYLLNITTEILRDRFDVSNLGSLMESRKSFGKVLLGFGDEIKRELSDPWSRMTLLVIIAGEFVAAALAKKVDRESEVLELCSTAAEDLCSRMMKLSELRSWEDFHDHIENRYNLVYHQHSSVSDASSLIVKKKIADVVQQFKKSSFFR